MLAKLFLQESDVGFDILRPLAQLLRHRSIMNEVGKAAALICACLHVRERIIFHGNPMLLKWAASLCHRRLRHSAMASANESSARSAASRGSEERTIAAQIASAAG